MTSGAVDAIRADRAALIDICGELTEAEWKAESGCAGWSVQDVVAHLGALFWRAVDPSVLPDAGGVDTERAQDVYVESRRSWTAAQVLDDYAEVSLKALEIAAGLETQDFELDLGDLGTYPISVVPNAYTFYHYTHIRADLFAPRGPLTGAPPPSDELRLRPTLDWIEAALPQQSAGAIAELPGAVEIVATGVAARTMVLGEGPVVASIESDGPALVRWITQRANWDDAGVKATGDDAALAVARTFKVF